MGVINEYFLAASDAVAAGVLEAGPVDGVLGPDPGSALASLEAIVLGIDPDSEEGIALVTREDHAVDVAHDVDYSRMVIKIATRTTQLIAKTPLDELRPHLSHWARADELAGIAAEDLADMTNSLHPLFVAAANNAPLSLYVWVSL